MHGVLHFEGKIWRTLPMLAFRPGRPDAALHPGRARAFRFADGAVPVLGVPDVRGDQRRSAASIEAPGDPQLDAGANAEVSVKQSRENLSRQLAKLDEQIAEAKAAGKNTGDLRGERANVAGLLRFMEGGPSVLSGAETRGKLLGFETGWARLDKGVAKANANPDLLLYKLQNNAYKFSWALIPLSVPFVWPMFFWKRRYRTYDHAVFVTYSLSFMTLLAIVLTVARNAGRVGRCDRHRGADYSARCTCTSSSAVPTRSAAAARCGGR